MRPTVGSYHCFGCGEGGDVISFVQKVEHLTFTESIERLAAKLGLELHYEEGGGPREGGVSLGKRSRLIEAHRVAQEFYAALLLDTGRPTPGPAATSCASGASTAPPPRRSASGSRRRAARR